MAIDVSVQKRLGDFSLDVSFSSPGGIVGLLGASGCGKSKTLQSIAGIEKPDRGFVGVDGKVLFDSEKKDRRACAGAARRLFVSGLCPLSEYDRRRKYFPQYSGELQ